MKEREGKLFDAFSSEKMSKMLPLALSVLALFSLFFYLGSIYGSGKDQVLENVVAGTDVKATECSRLGSNLKLNLQEFKSCNLSLQDYTPCTDPAVSSPCFHLLSSLVIMLILVFKEVMVILLVFAIVSLLLKLC